MSSPIIAVLFAVFVWWFSTGLVLLLNRGTPAMLAAKQLASALLAVLALAALHRTAWQDSVAAAYCAFSSALLVWGWHELSFLTGRITGPRKTALPPGLSEWRRFVEAVRVILWHELAIIAVGSFIVYITWGAPNQVGTGTFVVLWVMRTSAKLNLFLGVRNLSEAFLPPHLAYLESCFRRRRMNLLFPLSLLASVTVFVLLVMQAQAPGTSSAAVVGFSLVATMLALAIVEHGLLVLPLDSTALWRWALREAGRRRAASASA